MIVSLKEIKKGVRSGSGKGRLPQILSVAVLELAQGLHGSIIHKENRAFPVRCFQGIEQVKKFVRCKGCRTRRSNADLRAARLCQYAEGLSLAHEVLNALQVGTDSEGGYLVPDEFEHTLVEALEEQNLFRTLAHVIQTSSGDRKIPVVASKGTASWVDEEGAIPESDDSIGQVSIGAYKLGTMIKISEELLGDSVFDLESYISCQPPNNKKGRQTGRILPLPPWQA